MRDVHNARVGCDSQHHGFANRYGVVGSSEVGHKDDGGALCRWICGRGNYGPGALVRGRLRATCGADYARARRGERLRGAANFSTAEICKHQLSLIISRHYTQSAARNSFSAAIMFVAPTIALDSSRTSDNICASLTRTPCVTQSVSPIISPSPTESSGSLEH